MVVPLDLGQGSDSLYLTAGTGPPAHYKEDVKAELKALVSRFPESELDRQIKMLSDAHYSRLNSAQVADDAGGDRDPALAGGVEPSS